MASWESRIEVQKGNRGERIVRDYLESKGWIVYEPKTQGAHAFDKLCVKDKKHMIIAEVKTKARMNKWNASGFNTSHYEEYLNIHNKYGIEIFIFFVDEKYKQIYGNKLSVLKQPYKASDGNYPMKVNTQYGKTVTIFSRDVMIDIATINDEDAQFLKEHSKRNYSYSFIDQGKVS